MVSKPRLYGLSNSNRDFSSRKSWGKNIFNNAFPVALSCYMHHLHMQPVYLMLDSQGAIVHSTISVDTLLKIEPDNKNIFFAFESDYVPYRPLVVDIVPRADLVVLDRASDSCVSNLEIKLTALPDNSTWELSEVRYGCEIVVRPDTIVYLVLGIIHSFQDHRGELETILRQIPPIENWRDIALVAPNISMMRDILDDLLKRYNTFQEPLVLQPVWKTAGKKLTLHQDAFDVFVWSNFAFTRLFFRDADVVRDKLTRGARSIAWMTKMLIDFVEHGKVDHRVVIDNMSYNTKNDKAFAVNGKVTHELMACAELTKPRVSRDELKNIVLGGGEKYLSPERRLDAAILNTTGLFE